MADRTISVRLQAITEQYSRAMEDAGRKTQDTGKAVWETEQGSDRLSGALTRRLIPALGAAGLTRALKQSFEAASAMEGSLVKMETLVGLTTDEVSALAAGFGDLSRETGIAQQDLADAAFFITSAGLRGAAALDALEYAAKGAAIGLGETHEIADLLTSVMNAYGPEVISAAEATDILVGAVRNGKADAPEFAGALDRILPVASEMGVSFEEIAAATAAMTRTGSDAATATNSLRGILMALLRPSQQAEATLREFGLSGAEMRRQLREEGLLETLETLKETFDGNEEALARVIPRVEGLTGFMDLMGANVDNTRQTFDNMAETTGLIDEAFERYGETADIQSSRAKNAWEDFKRSFAEDSMPAITVALEEATFAIENDLIRGLWDLGAAGQTIADNIEENFGRIKWSAWFTGDAFEDFGRKGDELADQKDAWRGQADAYVDQLIGMADRSRDAADASDDLTGAVDDTEQQLIDTERAVNQLRDAYDRLIGKTMDAIETEMRWFDALQKVEEQIESGDDALNIHTETGRDNIRMLHDAIEAAFDHGASMMENGSTAQEAAGMVQTHIDTLMAQAREAGITEEQVQELIDTYGLTPTEIRTVMDADTRDADRLARNYQDVLNRLPRNITTTVRLNLPSLPPGMNWGSGGLPNVRAHTGGYVSPSGKIQKFHDGGMVGGLRSDEMPAILQTGEVVLSRQQVSLLGQALSSVPRMHDGGTARTTNVTVNNPAPEPASVSIGRQMRRLEAFGVFDG